MPRYVVSITIASPDVVVDAENEEEARELVETYINDPESDFPEIVCSMDAEIDQIDVVDPNEFDIYEEGIDEDNPFVSHNLNG